MRFWKRIAAASSVAAIVSVLGLLLVLMPASGADAVDQQVPGPLTGWEPLTESAFDTSQTFTPAYPKLTRVELYLRTYSAAVLLNPVNVTLDVYRASDFLPVATLTVQVPAGFSAGWEPFDFSTVTISTSPTQYILDVYVDDDTEQLSWGFDSGSAYAGGQAFLSGTAQSYDFLFRTYLEDVTGPVITPVLSVPAQPDDWYNTNVGLTWTVTDPDSAITATVGCLPQSIVADQNITAYSCTATSTGGVSGPVTVSIGRDTVKPVITYTRTPANANGWNNTNVTVTFSCTDERSGLATNTVGVPQVVSTEGVNQSASNPGTCVDNAGNVADTATVTGINIDKTAPTITAAATTAPNGAGWYNTDVTVTFNCFDSLSGFAGGACPPDQLLTAEGAAVSATQPTVTDLAGNTSAPSNLVMVKIDKTAPTATLAPVAGAVLGANGWYTSNVTMRTTGNDGVGSGIGSCTADQPFNSETTGITVNGSCTDVAGNPASAAPFNLKIDKTGPTGVFLSVTAGTPGAGGWYTSDVTIHTNGTDNISPFTCTADQFQTTDTTPAGVNFNGSCTNEAGLVTNAPVLNIKLDKTAPTAVLSVFSGTAGTNGWYTSDVVVQTTGTDATAGVPTCTANQTFNFETAGIVVNGSCTNAAGLTTNAAPLNLKIDKTAPTIVAAATTAPNGAGWYNSNVTVHFTCADALSGIATCPADQLLNSEGNPVSSTAQQATDLAGNTSANSNVVNAKIDKTAPVVSLVPTPLAPNANGWYKTDVTVDTQGIDPLSGISSCDADQLIGETGVAGLNVVGSCTDVAGNVGNAGPLNIKVDKTAPTVTLSTVPAAPNGDNGWFTSDVTVTPNGLDGLSGIDFCDAPQVVSTETAGLLVTLSCTDDAGNSASASTTIKLDKTAPTGSMAVVFGTLGDNGWYRSAVLVSATGADTISGPVVCTPALQGLGVETAGTLLNATCENQAGLTTPVSLNVKIDMTAPTVTLVTTPGSPDGTNGWFISPVTVDTQGTDALSGLTDPPACTANQVIASNTASLVVMGSCTDNAGNSSSASIVLRIDLTNPVAAMLITGGTLGDNGWYTSDVTVNTTGSDDISGPVSCAPPTETHSLETMSYIFSSTCTNQAGRTDTDSINVKIDKTPPEVEIIFLTGAPNVNGWSSENVALQAIVTEDMANPVVCTPNPIPAITVETAGQLVEVTCTNDAGLETTESVFIKLDKTPPVADIIVVEGTEGENGWYTTTVIAEAFGSDSLSGPVTCVPQLHSQSTETTGTDLISVCTNLAGLETEVMVNVKVDKTGPTNVQLAVTAGTLGNNGWYKTDVTVSTTSDVETVSPPVVCTADQFQTTDTVGQVFNGSCTNEAGLETEADPLTVKLDKTPPTLAPTVPAAIALNAVAVATPNATDATSGIASQSCGALVTTTAGNFTTTCTATDNAGNTTTVNVSYTVLNQAADCGKILFGTTPPLGGGIGTFAFSCGSIAQLIAVTGCPQSTMTIYYNKPGGGYAVNIPGSQVAAVNAEFLSLFNGNPQIPVNTIFSVKCV